MSKTYILNFREVDRDAYDLICNGKKSIETRAAAEKFADIVAGDILTLICGTDSSQKEVIKVERFSSIDAIYKKYQPHEINPTWKNEQDGRDAWASFPNYMEKIKKFGLIALTLKK